MFQVKNMFSQHSQVDVFAKLGIIGKIQPMIVRNVTKPVKLAIQLQKTASLVGQSYSLK
jgi:hypothetical protein